MYRLARHCDGRVRFWQCDNEPNNVGLTWLGTAQDYVAQLKVMHRAVNDADPAAAAVLGGHVRTPGQRTRQSGTAVL